MMTISPDLLVDMIPLTLQALETDRTRTAYAIWLNRFAKWYKESAAKTISYDLVINWMGTIDKEKYSPPSRIKALAAVKKLCETMKNYDRGMMDLYTYTIIKSIKQDKYEAPKQGRYIPDNDIKILFEACKRDDKPGGVRDAAIIAILHNTGMRRGECADLLIKDWNQKEDKLTLRNTKNHRPRTPYLNGNAVRYIQSWLTIRGETEGHVFWRIKKDGALLPGTELTGPGIYHVLKRRCIAAGIETCTPHDFRRTLISNLLNSNVDISLVSRIVGHSSPAVTARYDIRDEERMKWAANQIYTPY